MIPENQNTDNQIKAEQIISAAQVIFGRYGMKKTTMNEIAAELGISKALIYYYFPDKETLYKTVVEMELQVFISDLACNLKHIEHPDDMLIEFVTLRLNYFRSMLNLSRFRMQDWSGIKSKMENVWQWLWNKELEIVNNILSKGKLENIYHFGNTSEMSEIFLELLKGLSHTTIKKKQIFFLEQSEFETLIKKALAFTEIFIKGLKYNLIE